MAGIVSRIWDFFNNLPNSVAKNDASRLYLAKRSHTRHSTHFARIAWAGMPDSTRFAIRDLSYGGLAIECDPHSLSRHRDRLQVLSLTLHVLHLSVSTQVSIVHNRPNLVGCAFVHNDESTLRFLRNILEFMRRGSTLREIARGDIDLQLRSEGHSIYRGEMATSVSINRSLSGSVESCDLFFRDGGMQNRVTYQSGGISYQRFGDGGTEANLIALEQGFFLIIGMLEQFPEIGLDTVVEAFKETISLKIRPRRIL